MTENLEKQTLSDGSGGAAEDIPSISYDSKCAVLL